tara:strand:- start:57929 stop:58414 length:486 start_codon:yes stop_codon:yes gene_type:complete
MNITYRIVLSTALSLGALACSKSSDEAKAPERLQEVSTITLAELDNLKVDVAEGTEPNKMGGELMIMSMDESFTVGPVSSSTPATLDDAKKVAAEEKGAEIKSGSLDDGWWISYQAPSSLGESFYLKVRREIAGKSYICQTSVGHKSLRDGALAACKSLRP